MPFAWILSEIRHAEPNYSRLSENYDRINWVKRPSYSCYKKDGWHLPLNMQNHRQLLTIPAITARHIIVKAVDLRAFAQYYVPLLDSEIVTSLYPLSQFTARTYHPKNNTILLNTGKHRSPESICVRAFEYSNSLYIALSYGCPPMYQDLLLYGLSFLSNIPILSIISTREAQSRSSRYWSLEFILAQYIIVRSSLITHMTLGRLKNIHLRERPASWQIRVSGRFSSVLANLLF